MSQIIAIKIDTDNVEVMEKLKDAIKSIAQQNNFDCEMRGTFIDDGVDLDSYKNQIKQIKNFVRGLEDSYIDDEY